MGGVHLADDTECTKCGANAGIYAGEAGGKACDKCRPGTYQNNSGASFCNNCSSGTFSQLGASVCSFCNRGRHSNSSAADCENCPLGRFAVSRGSSSCETCPATQTTLTVSSFDFSDCRCGANFFWPNGKISSQQKCKRCPPSMTCEFGAKEKNIADGVSGPRPRVNQGFYSEWSAPLEVFECFSNAGACMGDLPGACSQGRSGLVCQFCPEQFFRSGDGCSSCDGRYPLLVCLLFSALTCVAIMHKVANDPLVTDLLCGQVLGFSLSVLLTFMQLMGVLGTMGIRFLEGSGFEGYSDVFMFQSSDYSLECISQKEIWQYFVQVCLFPGIVVLFLMVFGLSRWWPSKRMDTNRSINSLALINQTVLISLANLSLSAFQCFEHPNGERTLFAYSAVSCAGDVYVKFALLSITMLLTSLAPFNVMFVYAIIVVYQSRHEHRVVAIFLSRFKLCFVKWRPDRWFWGYVFVMRQQLLACSLTLFGGAPFARIFWSLWILVCYSMLLCLSTPWRVVELNVFECVVTLFIVLLVVCSSAFVKISSAGDYEILNTVLIFCCVSMAALYVVRLLVKMYFAGGWRSDFVPFPTPVDLETMDKCLFTVCNRIVDLPDDTRKTFLKVLTASERDVFLQYFRIVQNSSLNSLDLCVGVGPRFFVPRKDFTTQDQLNRFKSDWQNVKGKHRESYI